MILSDTTLHEFARNGLVSPYEPENIQGCSIDLTLGDTIKVETPKGFSNVFEEREIHRDPFLLMPGQFVLASTAETIKVPNNHCASLLLRSTAARAGFEHSFSGWCDPGFAGVLVLELRNNLQNHCLELKAGMRLVQLVVHKLDGKATAYELRGHYQNQVGVVESTQIFDRLAA